MDRNHVCIVTGRLLQQSLSARRAWIEITGRSVEFHLFASLSARRAWIEMRLADVSAAWNRSLSARRAWIEIAVAYLGKRYIGVALRKESVDRNVPAHVAVVPAEQSLSARRAWIEMSRIMILVFGLESLSARRAWIEIDLVRDAQNRGGGRSPQGERG